MRGPAIVPQNPHRDEGHFITLSLHRRFLSKKIGTGWPATRPIGGRKEELLLRRSGRSRLMMLHHAVVVPLLHFLEFRLLIGGQDVHNLLVNAGVFHQ